MDMSRDRDVPILIIEDDEAISSLFTNILKNHGYTNIFTAYTGEEGIELFKKHEIPIITIDYTLPKMSGMDVLKIIKQLYPPSQILIITANRDTDLIKEALREGACDYFHKPVANDRIVRTIDRCVEKHRLLKENEAQFLQLKNTLASLEDKVLKRTQKLSQTNYELCSIIYKAVDALAKAVEIRDAYTAGHQERVTMLALAIAKELKLTKWQISNIELAGPIHDIGKIAVPNELLTKPTDLSNSEFGVIQQHCETGYWIIEDIPFHADIANIVKQHHERMDGSGYPNHLKGEDILIESRIIAIADIVEAMSANRPYRVSKGINAAVEVLNDQRNIGKLWDEGVDACLAILDRYDNDVSSVFFNAQLDLIKSPNNVRTIKNTAVTRINCWDFKHCDKKEQCPAYPDHGDHCAAIVDTLCDQYDTKLQSNLVSKLVNCLTCDFQNSPYYSKSTAKTYLQKLMNRSG